MQDITNKYETTNILRLYIAFFLTWTLFAISFPSYADKVPQLYEAKIPVFTQGREERNEAIRKAFAEVLVRISGRADIVGSEDYPGIITAIESATRYAQQFRFYQANPQPTDKKAPKLILWVRFDEKAVSRLLSTNQLPVWGDARPATLVWLVVDNRGHRQLVGNDVTDPTHAVIQERARVRGVPLRFPLLDLTDRSSLRVSDVWGNFESTILKASQRYQTEAVLVGRVYQGYSGSWTARWSLYADGRRQDWAVTGTEVAEVLAPGIDKTAESLAVRYAQVGQTEDGQVLVLIKDIKGLADYNRAMNYLQALSHVSKVNPYQVEQQSAIFQLITAGGRLGVARSVALGHTLISEPVSSVPVAGSDSLPADKQLKASPSFTNIIPDLIYRLVP